MRGGNDAMSIDEIRERISELSAEFDRTVEAHPDFLRIADLLRPSEDPHAHLLAQARVELAVYTGAMKSVGTLFQRAIDSADFVLAEQASTVMSAMEDSFALARATVDELLRADNESAPGVTPP